MDVIRDKYGLPLMDGDVIDIGQTVNGCSEFYIMCLEKYDIRYNYDRSRKYEYDCKDLLSPSKILGEIEFTILNPF